LRLGVVIVVVAELAAEDGLDAQADALTVIENPVEEFGELIGRGGAGEAFLMFLGKVGEDLEVGVAEPGEGGGGVVGLGTGGFPIQQVEGGALSGILGVEEAGLDSFHRADENNVRGGDLTADRHGHLAFAGKRRDGKQDPEEDGAAHPLIIAGPPKLLTFLLNRIYID
jgi:hypothetical protein